VIPLQDYETILMDAIPGASQEEAQNILAQLGLSADIQEYLNSLIPRMEAGEDVGTLDEIWKHINQMALEKYGCEYGVPMPSVTDPQRPLITAKGTPLHDILRYNNYTDERIALIRRRIPVRNSWFRLADEEQFIVLSGDRQQLPAGEDPGDCSDHLEPRPMALCKSMAGGRMRKFIDTILMRSGSQQTVEAEFAAMEKLKGMVHKGSWRSYILNGAFAEHSKKSDLHYIFRKGFPTVVLSYHGKRWENQGHIICCLCMHPLGYYQGTYCGLMCPTDEVIAHLLAMRTDEHDYWSQCGQWAAADPRSGL
jgi:hypothetical protein